MIVNGYLYMARIKVHIEISHRAENLVLFSDVTNSMRHMLSRGLVTSVLLLTIGNGELRAHVHNEIQP